MSDRSLATTNNAVAPIDQNVFLAFDRLDDDQIIAEMKGAALQEYVYEFGEGGKTVRGLSKAGTDDASRIMAVKYGEVLREVDVWMEHQDEEAGYFKAKVSRFMVRSDGTTIEMDSAIGQKRQAKKVNGKPNAFWYEQGGQKALRNAKQKLMPETIKQAIIQSYVEAGRIRRVKQEEVQQSTNGHKPTQAATKAEPAQTPPPESPAPKLWARWNDLKREAEALGLAVPLAPANITKDELVQMGKDLAEDIRVWRAQQATQAQPDSSPDGEDDFPPLDETLASYRANRATKQS